jgi:hypothetical protein
MKNLFLLLCLVFIINKIQSQTLPPTLPWQGKSLAYMVKPEHPLATTFEKSKGLRSANPEQLVSLLEDFAEQPLISINEIAKSPLGFPVYAIRISTDAEFRNGNKQSQKPLILFQAGIHAGEIDGLEAGLMIVRDLCTGRLRSLLEKVDVVFIPVINPDGFARQSSFNRINQRGPQSMGWRTNSLNQNLNRDYTKLDTPELRGLMELINKIKPDLYFDIHVTDGADYQYDITYGWTPKHAYSPGISLWLDNFARPYINASLGNEGHIPGPLIFAKNGVDFSDGNADYIFSPRFSHSWGDAVHIPTILVENHSLKPFIQRVLGTYVLMESAIRLMAEKGAGLKAVIENDKKLRNSPITLGWSLPESTKDSIFFKGIESREMKSDLTNVTYTQWLGKVKNETIKSWSNTKIAAKTERKSKFIIPVQYKEVISVIEKHGIEFERMQKAETLEVTMYKLKNVEMQGKLPFQGRVRLKGETSPIKRKQVFPMGSIVVDTDQPLGTFAHLLLEPDAGDSFFQWGFFNGITERTEYFEDYAMVPMAEEMASRNPELMKKYKLALENDTNLKNDSNARLRWWYERSPYYDDTYLLYPIGMIK